MFSYYHQIAAIIATFATITAFLPQVYKTLKTKSGVSLSPVAFLLSYGGSVILCVFSSIHDPFVWTTLIVDLSIAWLMLPIFWYIAIARTTIKRTVALLFALAAVNVAITVVFALTRVGTIATGLNEITEFCLATVGFAMTGFAFFPQTIRIIKNRRLGDFSLLLAITYGISQSLNVVFWSGRVFIDKTDWLDWVPGIVFAGVSVLVQSSTVVAVAHFRVQRVRLEQLALAKKERAPRTGEPPLPL